MVIVFRHKLEEIYVFKLYVMAREQGTYAIVQRCPYLIRIKSLIMYHMIGQSIDYAKNFSTRSAAYRIDIHPYR